MISFYSVCLRRCAALERDAWPAHAICRDVLHKERRTRKMSDHPRKRPFIARAVLLFSALDWVIRPRGTLPSTTGRAKRAPAPAKRAVGTPKPEVYANLESAHERHSVSKLGQRDFFAAQSGRSSQGSSREGTLRLRPIRSRARTAGGPRWRTVH